MNLRKIIEAIRTRPRKREPDSIGWWPLNGPIEWCLAHRCANANTLLPESSLQQCFACVIRDLRAEQKEWPHKLLEARQGALLEAAKMVCGHCSQGHFPLHYRRAGGLTWEHEGNGECRASRIHDAIVKVAM